MEAPFINCLTWMESFIPDHHPGGMAYYYPQFIDKKAGEHRVQVICLHAAPLRVSHGRIQSHCATQGPTHSGWIVPEALPKSPPSKSAPSRIVSYTGRAPRHKETFYTPYGCGINSVM
jgi:hypothetical protein